MGWVGLDQVRLAQVGLGWVGSGWVRSGRVGSGQVGLGRVRSHASRRGRYVRGPAFARLHGEEREEGVEHVVVVELPAAPQTRLHVGQGLSVRVHKVLAPENSEGHVAFSRLSPDVKLSVGSNESCSERAGSNVRNTDWTRNLICLL